MKNRSITLLVMALIWLFVLLIFLYPDCLNIAINYMIILMQTIFTGSG